ncbi:MAG: IclR family transcriptional regulator [Ottowia sp.]|uniref:IclR family transcriptional regulator n=1 Tax=Ottowia sp. TaxID=1898956 RepID=UPI003C726783
MRNSVDHPSAGPSVIQRVMSILNLFSRNHTVITVEEISEVLGMSSASAYRYASELSQAGLLARSSGKFRLGPKIIELEYLIRFYDPVISAAQDLMEGLAELTSCDVLLCNFYEDTIVNVSHIPGRTPARITYSKGLPMPLFRGSQAHVVLAHLDRRKLRRLYDAGMSDPALRPDVCAIGADWPRFLSALKAIRERGHYVSRSELDSSVTGFAAPVFGEAGEIVSSIVVAANTGLPLRMPEESMITLVVQTAQVLSQRLISHSK